MTKTEAMSFQERWQFVNNLLAAEIRNTPPEVRLQQLRTVFVTAHRFQPPGSSAHEEEEIRERWRFLRESVNART